jgi:hypothetical protein
VIVFEAFSLRRRDMATPNATPARSAVGGVIAMTPGLPLVDPTKGAPPHAVIDDNGREWPVTRSDDGATHHAKYRLYAPPVVKDPS